jgi:hypothetical protein
MNKLFHRPNCISLTPPSGVGGLLLLVIILLGAGNLQAQEAKHYLNFDLGSGVHNLKYDLPNGKVKNQYGYSASMGYTYFFDQQWGLGSGVGVQSYGANPILNYTSATPAIDEKGDPYEFRNNYTNWQETQKALFVEVPLTVQFRHSLSKKLGLLVSVGAKVSIPVSSTYETTGGEMVASGYYSQWDAELYGLPQHGLGNYTSTYSGDLMLTQLAAFAHGKEKIWVKMYFFLSNSGYLSRFHFLSV